MTKLQSLLWIGLCTLVCFVQAMKDQKEELTNSSVRSGGTLFEIDNADPKLGEIKKLIESYVITDENIIETAATYFLYKINENNSTGDMNVPKLKALFEKTYEKISNDLNVNELIQKSRGLTKVFYPSPRKKSGSKVKKSIGEWLQDQGAMTKVKKRAPTLSFPHICPRCSQKKFVYYLDQKDGYNTVINTKAICLDCAISDFDLTDLMEHDYVELVVIFLLTQYGSGQTRFQDSTIAPQLIADALFVISSAINFALFPGDDVYGEGFKHTAYAYQLAMIVYFSMQFLGTFLFAVSMYYKRIRNKSNPILICGQWNINQSLFVLFGFVSIVTTLCFKNHKVSDAFNGIMFTIAALHIWPSQKLGLLDSRYIDWNENYLALAVNKGFKPKQMVLEKSWREGQGFFSRQLLSLMTKCFCASNGFMACSLLQDYTNAHHIFGMPAAFIHCGLIANVMIWGSWFLLTFTSFFIPEMNTMSWDKSLSFSYKLIQIAIAFGIMLCTTAFDANTKLYINFGSFMIPVMGLVINQGWTWYNQNLKNEKKFIQTALPPKMKYNQLKNPKKSRYKQI